MTNKNCHSIPRDNYFTVEILTIKPLNWCRCYAFYFVIFIIVVSMTFASVLVLFMFIIVLRNYYYCYGGLLRIKLFRLVATSKIFM